MSCDIYKFDVLAMAPELTTLTELAWVDILAFANAMSPVGFDNDPSAYRFAKILLCAHYGTVSRRASSSGSSGTSGPVIREAAGGLQRSYAPTGASSSASTSNFTQTMYGQQYLSLLQMCAPHGPFLV